MTSTHVSPVMMDNSPMAHIAWCVLQEPRAPEVLLSVNHAMMASSPLRPDLQNALNAPLEL
jgi:hypothetical protein